MIAAELRLPWPDRRLSPNARIHWARRSKLVKMARIETAWYVTVAAGWNKIALPDGRLHLWLDYYPPDRRQRDTDNCLSASKAQIDGIADALGIDDHRFVPHPYLKDEVRKGGEIRVRLTGGPDAAPIVPR
ncbi:hypothetical protein [Sphingomonas sp.]|uniref:hypothetical protein n=1 Tax=Sphingomonas sp. TaxID=28214 RepID=UPI003562D63F